MWKNRCSEEYFPPRGEMILRERIGESARLIVIKNIIRMLKLREVNKGTIYGAGEKCKMRKKNLCSEAL
jgi:hypothetical protein